MESKEGTKSLRNTLELREPKRKRRVRLEPQQPFPVCVGSKSERVVYTGHLSALGVCVVQPDEIKSLNSMGFFGKGSLSRSFPNFGRARYGAPPVVRNRQWARRQEWLEAAKELEAESFLNNSKDEDWDNVGHLDCGPEAGGDSVTTEQSTVKGAENKHRMNEKMEETTKGVIIGTKMGNANPITASQNDDSSGESNDPRRKKMKFTDDVTDNIVLENNRNKDKHSAENNRIGGDIIEISENENEYYDLRKPVNTIDRCDAIPEKRLKTTDAEVYEVVLDSTEEEDVCEIMNKETDDNSQKSSLANREIILLNEEDIRIRSDVGMYNENENIESCGDPNATKLLVLQDSESDSEDYLTYVQPRIENEGFPVTETLHLTFEETFFLMFGLGCLQIVDFDGNLLGIKDTWNYFCETKSDFVQKYVAYHYFRSKGWVVKPGLKYGGDFLLYKQGPPFHHASYIVIVEVVDADTLMRDDNKTVRKMTWNKLFGLDRLSETAAKEILFAQVLWPSSIPRDTIPSTPEVLTEFTVKEVLWRRWIPKQKREEICLEDDDDS